MVKRTLLNLAKLIVLAGIFFYLFKYAGFDLSKLGKAFVHIDLLSYAFIFTFIGLTVTSERWRFLLSIQGIHLSVFQAFKLTFVGFLFSVSLPGSVSGDVIKAYYIAKGRDQKSVLITSVIFDRLIGVYSMFFIAAFTISLVYIGEMISGNAGVWSTPYFRAIGVFTILLFIFVTAVCVLFMSVSIERIPVLMKIVKRLPLHEKFLNVYRAVHSYGRKPLSVIIALLISTFAQIPGYIGIWFMASILGVKVFTFIDFMIILPLCYLFNSIPIAPAGLGIGEVGFGKIFRMFGSNEGAEVAFLMHAILIFISVVFGGLIYLLTDLSKTSVHISKKEKEES